ncbi:uncharacterized protein LODBEIA_P06640 [Lodderomyces beijingensis]|uniref:Protein farnesyltransferase/geranylgeranyltransferase type-1 subunit alpha n=1 Tax=Lodderomyces beijingensis TaxID=1775926 RepID=A0ABP0ZH00_9ASCO
MAENSESFGSFDYSDVTPVSLNAEEPQLCQILYDSEYKQVMGLLLALMKKNEYSERAKHITELGIEALASHYTTWIYRFKILKNLPNTNYFDELDWCEQVALDNEKNYQIWNYRQLIIGELLSNEARETIEARETRIFDPHREYPILEAMLDSDPKNHHVWTYRKWLVEKFKLYEDAKELEFVDSAIELDLLNNSAWSHRFFLKFSHAEANLKDGEKKKELLESEIAYAKEKIRGCPQNASSWNYLLGIYHKFDRDITELEGFAREFVDLEKGNVTSSFAMESLAEIYKRKQQYTDSVRQYELLRDKYDPIRKNFWEYEIRKVKELS